MSHAGTATTRLLRFLRLPAVLVWAFALAFGFTLTGAVDPHDGTISTSAVYAKGKGGGNGGGNSGGNGNGKGRSGAPGQTDQDVVDDGFGSTGATDDVEAAVAESGHDADEPAVPDIADDPAPATIQVIKELGGLPDQSALSEEEELEAIRNGWGTWRTADGPETILAQ